MLDPFKEKLNLPSLFVKLGNGERLQFEVIRQKDKGFAGIRVVELYAAQLFRIGLPAFFVSRKPIWSQINPVLLSTGLEYTRLN